MNLIPPTYIYVSSSFDSRDIIKYLINYNVYEVTATTANLRPPRRLSKRQVTFEKADLALSFTRGTIRTVYTYARIKPPLPSLPCPPHFYGSSEQSRSRSSHATASRHTLRTS